MEYNVLGSGQSGFVIHPCIGCSEKTISEPHLYVTKIIRHKKYFDQEIEAFQMLPESLNTKLYYNFYEICDVQNEEIQQVLQQLIDKGELKPHALTSYILNTTYIDGMELQMYLEHYKTVDNQTNKWNSNYKNKEIIPIISLPIFVNLLNLIKQFYENILELNSYNIFHNDIATNNIMINKDATQLYLIDLGRMSKKARFDVAQVDINGLDEVITHIIDCGYYNEEIKSLIDIVKSTQRTIDINFVDLLLSMTGKLGGKKRKSKNKKRKKNKKSRKKK
jgi:serine/threonine protein kinase